MTAGTTYEEYLSDVYIKDLIESKTEKALTSELPSIAIDHIDQMLNFLCSGTIADTAKLMTELELPDESVLPPVSKRIYGCLTCEWRGTNKCPVHTIHRNKPKLMPGRGICKKRVTWLRFMSYGLNTGGIRPTIAQWQESFERQKIIIQNSKDLQRLDRLQAKMDELESDAINKTVGDIDMDYLERRRREVKTEWLDISKLLLKSLSDQVTRETPKKLEVETKRSIPLNQIHEIMRGDYKVITENEKEL